MKPTAAVACIAEDAAVVGGKLNITGVFDMIVATSFPVVRTYVVVARIQWIGPVPRDVQVRLTLHDPEGRPSFSYDHRFSNPTAVTQGSGTLDVIQRNETPDGTLAFLAPGMYQWSLTVGGQRIAWMPIHVAASGPIGHA